MKKLAKVLFVSAAAFAFSINAQAMHEATHPTNEAPTSLHTEGRDFTQDERERFEVLLIQHGAFKATEQEYEKKRDAAEALARTSAYQDFIKAFDAAHDQKPNPTGAKAPAAKDSAADANLEKAWNALKEDNAFATFIGACDNYNDATTKSPGTQRARTHLQETSQKGAVAPARPESNAASRTAHR